MINPNPIAAMTTDALAVAEADAAELRLTIEHLHSRLAFARLEIAMHLEHAGAADRRTRSFESALTAEREASKGLVALLRAERDEADGVRNMAVAEAEGLAEQLEQIRDLVAPAAPDNLEGTVLDAVRARMAKMSNYEDIAIQRATDAERERDTAIARAEKAERTALSKLSPAPACEVAPTHVLVHADGGDCHGSRVVGGHCVGCGQKILDVEIGAQRG